MEYLNLSYWCFFCLNWRFGLKITCIFFWTWKISSWISCLLLENHEHTFYNSKSYSSRFYFCNNFFFLTYWQKSDRESATEWAERHADNSKRSFIKKTRHFIWLRIFYAGFFPLDDEYLVMIKSTTCPFL